MALLWLGPKLARVIDNPHGEYGHWCPGCQTVHEIAVDAPNPSGARWRWDGNIDTPTFSPSVNIRIGPYCGGRMEICHYFLTAGRLSFCGDSTHKFTGMSLSLEDIPARWSRFSPAYHPPVVQS